MQDKTKLCDSYSKNYRTFSIYEIFHCEHTFSRLLQLTPAF
uniref:Uncharacterized protein n=1 Tax=Rhizophora mucronata TaxID=61149 RepID=A0A2P2ND99_RHIMU